MSRKKVDRRVARTKDMLAQALVSLMRERGYEVLTVQDIIDRANVGRSTFYAHYGDKEDLLGSSLENLRDFLKGQQRAAWQQSPVPAAPALGFVRDLLDHVQDHRDLFRSMVGKRSGAVVQKHFQRMLVDLVREEVRALAPSAAGGTPSEAVTQFVAGGLFGLLSWWMDGRTRVSVEEMHALCVKLAGPALRATAR